MFICSLWTRLSKTKGFFYVTDLIFGGFGKNYKHLPPFFIWSGSCEGIFGGQFGLVPESGAKSAGGRPALLKKKNGENLDFTEYSLMGWSQSHICTVLLTIQRYTTFHEILTFVNCFLTVQVGLLSASPQQSTYLYRAAFDLLLLICSLSPSVCSLTSSCILSLHLSIFSHHLSVFFSSGSLTSSVCCLLY